MQNRLIVAAALAAVCCSIFAAAHQPGGIERGGSISPGYLEIEKWIRDNFGEDVYSGHLSKYRSASVGAPVELRKTPQDWEDFAKLDAKDCSLGMVQLLKRVLANSDTEWFRVTATSLAPPHPIQRMLLGVATMHAVNCHDTYEAETLKSLRVADDQQLLDFVHTLSNQARSTCNSGDGHSDQGGALQPWRANSADFYKCVRKNPRIFARAIEESKEEEEEEEAAAEGESKKEPAASEKARAELETKSRLEECGRFVNVVDSDGLYERLEFDSVTKRNPLYSDKFNGAWLAYQVCKEFLTEGDFEGFVNALVLHQTKSRRKGLFGFLG